MVPCDRAQHGPHAEEIFRDSFGGSATEALYGHQGSIKAQILLLNNQPIGFISYQDERTANAQIIRHIGHFAITQNYRNQGHGSYLMQEFEKQARTDQVSSLDLFYEIEAKTFYEKHGFEPDTSRSLTMMKTL
jgi:GNAT superfamily N-acetyltransferase